MNMNRFSAVCSLRVVGNKEVNLLKTQHYPKKMVHAMLAGYVEHKQNKDNNNALFTVYAAEVLTKEESEAKIVAALRSVMMILDIPPMQDLCPC